MVCTDPARRASSSGPLEANRARVAAAETMRSASSGPPSDAYDWPLSSDGTSETAAPAP
jgi:hypothetical protein